MSRLDNLSAYEEKMLSSENCPICGGNLWIITNWMDRTFDAPHDTRHWDDDEEKYY